MNRKIFYFVSKCMGIILLLILSQNPQKVFADTGRFTYNIGESGITITGYKGDEQDLVIPQQMDGYTVVGISQDAFSGMSTLTSIIIPDYVSYIGNNAFGNCSNLTSVRFMGDAPVLGELVFANCKSDLILYVNPDKAGITNPWYGFTTIAYHSATEIAVTGLTLNTTSASLLIGETMTLLPAITPAEATNKKISWSSSNPSVATVDSLGQVTCLTVGEVEITAITDDGKLSATCKLSITNQLITPSGEFAVPKDYDKVKISWNRVTNAAGYDIYRYDEASGEYSNIATVNALEYQDSGLIANKSYRYKVRAYQRVKDTTFYSELTPKITVTTLKKNIGSTLFLYMSSLENRNSVYAKAVKLHYGNPNNTCAITVSEAFRRLGVNMPNSTIRTNQVEDHLVARGWKREMDLNLLQPGDICFTTDRHGNLLGGHATHVFIFMGWANKEKTLMNICDNQISRYGKVLHTRTIYSSKLTSKTAFFYHTEQSTVSQILKITSQVKATTIKGNSVKLSWKATDGAYGYKIYRATSRKGPFVHIASTKSTSYKNSRLTEGKTYFYKVRAYNNIGSSVVYGGYSNIIGISPFS